MGVPNNAPTEPSATDVYKKRQKIAKWLKRTTPIVFWVCIALAILCFIFAVENSFGNVAEIQRLLDTKKLTGEQVTANYDMLVEKYGEWVIGQAGTGVRIRFVNVGKALFSGLMVANAVLCVFFLVAAFVLGKWALPRIAEQLTQDNQDMVNLKILQMDKKD